jgi:hypothetical protein
MSDQGRVDWQAQLLRFTLFTPGVSPEFQTIWRNITGRDPDVDENRARESIRRQSGPVGNRQLETVVTLGRVDVVMVPALEDGLPAMYFGQAEAEIPGFVSLIGPWLDQIAQVVNIVRLAFGAVLLLTVEDRNAGYRELDRLLTSVKVDPVSTREMLYRVNRPKPYADGLELNRVTTWNSGTRQTFGLSASAGQPSMPISEEFYVRLEVDNNTPAQRTEPLEPSKIVPIFQTLVKMALENALRGEIP